jgi:glutamate synthase (NADPH/NADH) small chain
MDDRDMQGCGCSSGQEDSQAFVHRRYRVEMPSLDPSLSISSFDEVEKGLTEEMAVAEAMRCLGCRVGLCVGCSICAEI